MDKTQQARLIELLGEDGALLLVAEFPNLKLPGKKFIRRLLRNKLKGGLEGEAAIEFLGRCGHLYKQVFGRKMPMNQKMQWPPWSRESIVRELGMSLKIW